MVSGGQMKEVNVRFKHTEIGEIPEEWEMVRLGDGEVGGCC